MTDFDSQPGYCRESEHELKRCRQDIKQLQAIVDQIPQLVQRVANDCGVEYINQPCIYRRGELWRYHKVRASNDWADADTPLKAAEAAGVD